MKEKILERLRQIEKDNDVRIIYAIESGSRMWGFASETSDYDIRFIYINNPRYYLSVNKKKDYIEVMDKEKNLDFAGWDIKKSLSLLLKSNMSLYEWINSPVIYVNSDEMESFISLSEYLWEKKNLIYSYIHLARGNYQHYIVNKKEIKLKKYLYILRTIAACMWLEKNNVGQEIENEGYYISRSEIISRYSRYPVSINELSLVIKEDNKYIYDLLQKIIKAKKEGKELSTSKPNKKANEWIEKKIEYYKNYAYRLGCNDDLKYKENRILLIKFADNFLYSTVLQEIKKREQKLPTPVELEINTIKNILI